MKDPTNRYFALDLIELRTKLEESEAALDLCAYAFERYRHMVDYPDHRNRQFEEPMEAAMKHPAMQAAEERRKKKFWDFMKRTAKEVESWPAWKRGALYR
jgi:hypothetical protein